MTKKWVRFLVMTTLNLVTLPLVPVVFVVMTILMICSDISFQEHLIDIIRDVTDLWRAMLIGIKASIENARDYVDFGFSRDFEETVNDILYMVMMEEEP